jgi:hypothetical protein
VRAHGFDQIESMNLGVFQQLRAFFQGSVILDNRFTTPV